MRCDQFGKTIPIFEPEINYNPKQTYRFFDMFKPKQKSQNPNVDIQYKEKYVEVHCIGKPGNPIFNVIRPVGYNNPKPFDMKSKHQYPYNNFRDVWNYLYLTTKGSGILFWNSNYPSI